MAEIVRRRSWGGVLPLGRHVSISGSRSIHAPSVSIAPSSFQEEQNARHHKQFKLEQALVVLSPPPIGLPSARRTTSFTAQAHATRPPRVPGTLRVMRSLLHSLALARTSLATSLSEVGAGDGDGIVGCGSSLGLKLAASSAATAGGTSPAFRGKMIVSRARISGGCPATFLT